MIDIMDMLPPKSAIVIEGKTYYIESYVSLLLETIKYLNEELDAIAEDNEQLYKRIYQTHEEDIL